MREKAKRGGVAEREKVVLTVFEAEDDVSADAPRLTYAKDGLALFCPPLDLASAEVFHHCVPRVSCHVRKKKQAQEDREVFGKGEGGRKVAPGFGVHSIRERKGAREWEDRTRRDRTGTDPCISSR